ncbi:MAG: hypothetical protein HW411_1650, partial [Gammaproteobacteria bacterium]|nr:hypothetical protein [Gammaproteobacteria bacterium]
MRFLAVILLALLIAAVAGGLTESSTSHIILTFADWTV